MKRKKIKQKTVPTNIKELHDRIASVIKKELNSFNFEPKKMEYVTLTFKLKKDKE